MCLQKWLEFFLFAAALANFESIINIEIGIFDYAVYYFVTS